MLYCGPWFTVDEVRGGDGGMAGRGGTSQEELELRGVAEEIVVRAAQHLVRFSFFFFLC